MADVFEQFEEKKKINSKQVIQITSILAIIFISILIRPSISGFSIAQQDLTSYTQDFYYSTNLSSDSVEFTMLNYPESFELKAFKISGSYQGTGTYSIYLRDSEFNHYLIAASESSDSPGAAISGYLVRDAASVDLPTTEQSPAEGIGAERGSEGVSVPEESVSTPEDIEETTSEETVEETTTEERTASLPVEETTSEETVEETTTEDFEQSGQTNEESAPTTEGRQDTSAEETTNNSSEAGGVSVPEESVSVSFENECTETCALPVVLNDTSYEIYVELSSGRLTITDVTYIIADVTSSETIVENTTEYPATIPVENVTENATLPTPSDKNISFSTDITDASGSKVQATFEFKDTAGNLVASKVPPSGKTLGILSDTPLDIPAGTYNLEVTFEDNPIEKIQFDNLIIDENVTEFVKVDNPTDNQGYVELYAIDPTQFNFTSATVTVTATGSALYKCKEWNFTTQSCYGTWNPFKTGLVPGQEYTFTLTPDDPGFGEGASVQANSAPTHSTPTLTSTDGSNDINQNITCYNQSTTDADSDPVKNIFNWKKNSTSITVLNMPFEGGSNSTYAKDYSGYGNDGTVSGSAAWNSTNGYDGFGTYTFDGFNYIRVPDSDNLDLTDNFTIIGWFYYEGDIGSKRLIAKESPSEWSYRLLNLDGGVFEFNDGLLMQLSADGTANTLAVQLNNVLSDKKDQWVFHAATYDGNILRLYINDQEAGNSTGSISVHKSSADLNIGSGRNGVWNFTGNIDDVTIYNKSLSADQIIQIYQSRTDLIISQETNSGDQWQCSVTPNDGTEDGSTLNSNSLTIVALDTTPPTWTETPTNQTIEQETSFSYDINATDNVAIDTYSVNDTTNFAISGSGVLTNNTALSVGSYYLNLSVNDTSNNILSTLIKVTVQDTTPTAIVTGLANQSAGTTWIYWNWTNPADADFNSSIIYLNGTWQQNTSSNFYNATNLTANTNYTITINTKDNIGNVNTTNVTSTVSTASTPASPTPSTTTSSGSSSSGGGGGGGSSVSLISTVADTTQTVKLPEPKEKVITLDKTDNEDNIIHIKITTYNDVEGADAIVKKHNIRPITLAKPEGIVLTYLEINTLNIKNTDIKSADINFRVPKKLMDSNKLTKDKITVLRYVDGTWQTLETKFIKQENEDFIFKATTPGLSYFAIVGNVNKNTGQALTGFSIAPINKQNEGVDTYVYIIVFAAILTSIYLIRTKTKKPPKITIKKTQEKSDIKDNEEKNNKEDKGQLSGLSEEKKQAILKQAKSIAAITIIVALLILVKPTITSFIISQQDLTSYTQDYYFQTNSTTSVAEFNMLNYPDEFELKAFKVSGTYEGTETYHIYLRDSDSNKYLIATNEQSGIKAKISGFLVRDVATIDLPSEPEDETSSPVEEEETVTLPVEEPTEEEEESEEEERQISLPAVPTETFENECIETCSLSAVLDSTSYELVVELDSGLLTITDVTYIIADVTSSETIVENTTEYPATIPVENVTENATLPTPSGKNISFSTDITDASGSKVQATFEFKDTAGNLVASKVPPSGKTLGILSDTPLDIPAGTYNLEVTLEDNPVQTIEFDNLTITDNVTEFIKVDDPPDNQGYDELYAIDPSDFNFTSATVTVTATGSALYKCKEWNLTNQECMPIETCTDRINEDGNPICHTESGWVYLQNITPGEIYTFTLTPEDPGYKEISYDNVSSATSSATNSITWSHTIASGTDRVLVVGTAIEDGVEANTNIINVTYNGVALTQAVEEATGTTYYMNTEIWYLLEDNLPPAGTYTIEVTAASTCDDITGGAISLNNVSQSAPEATVTNEDNQAGWNSISTNITTLIDNAWLIDVVGSGNALTGFTPAAGQTERWDKVASSSRGAMSTKQAATAGLAWMNWTTDSNSNRIAHAVAAFAPAVSNSAPTHSTPTLSSDLGTNLTTEDITCYNQSTSDSDGDSVKNIFNWKKNSTSITVLNMPFEGGSNSTYAKDYSDLANHGTVSDATWNSTGGYDGFGAYTFDGQGDTINLGDDSSFNITNALTLAAWIKPTLVGADVFGHKNAVIRKNGAWALEIATTNVPAVAIWNESGTIKYLNANTTMSAGNWYFVVLTYDSENDYAKIYVNGEYENQILLGGNLNTNSNRVDIGSNAGVNLFFNGTIDEAMIFDHSLSSEQIQALYNNRTDLIVAQETNVDDVWQCSVTPNDGTEDGTTLNSNTLTIASDTDATPPTVNLVSPSEASTDTDGLIIFQYNTSDSESAVTSCSLYINGTVKETNSSITEDTTQSFAQLGLLTGEYKWNVTCNSTGGSGSATRNLTIASAIFEDTFTSAGGFDNDSSNTAPWEQGTAVQVSCYDDSSCWGTDLNANYYATGPYDDYLTQVPGMDLSNYENVTLWFYHYRYFEDASTLWDGGVVDIYNTSWTRLTPNEGYTGNKTTASDSSLNNQYMYALHGSGWELATFNLSNYSGESGIKVRYHFATDNATNDYGWFIDSVRITGDPIASNSAPTHSAPTLSSDLGTNLTTEDITCYNQSTSDSNGDNVTNIFTFYKDGTTNKVFHLTGDNNLTDIFGDNPILESGTSFMQGKFSYGMYLSAGDELHYNATGNINTTQGTIEFWINAQSDIWENGATNNFFEHKISNQNQIYIRADANNYTRFRYEGSNDGQNYNWQGSDSWTSGEWHHIAMTWDGSVPEYKAYADGQLLATRTSIQPFNETGGYMEIGEDAGQESDSILDEFIIYNRVLSDEEINLHYNETYNTILSSETSSGETWYCEVTPSDGFLYGTTLASNNLTIATAQDTTSPVINSISNISSVVTAGENITITANITDDNSVSSALIEISGTNYTMTQLSIPTNKSVVIRPTTEGTFENNTARFRTKSFDNNLVSYALVRPGDYLSAATSNQSDLGTITTVSLNARIRTHKRGTGANFSIHWANNSTNEGTEHNFTGIQGQTILFSQDVTSERVWNWSDFANMELHVRHESGTSKFKIKEMWFAVNYTQASATDIWTYEYNTSGLTSGVKTYIVYANDSSGNTATSSSGNFTITTNITINEVVENSTEDPLNLTVEILDINSTTIYNTTDVFHTQSLTQGNYTVKIKPTNSTIQEIQFENLSISSDVNEFIDIDPSVNTTKGNKSYAVNPILSEFDNATVFVTASQNVNTLLKCTNWNFTSQECMETCETEDNETSCIEPWEMLQEINASQNYNFTINATDPAFAETSEAIDVALAPINNTAFIVAWVDKTNDDDCDDDDDECDDDDDDDDDDCGDYDDYNDNHEWKDIVFKIMNPDGSTIVNTTDVDTSADVNSRVSVTMVNSTAFIITWIDGPSKDVTYAIYNVNGSNIIPPTDIDTNVKRNTDVSVTQMGDRFAVCYANDADNDADFKIYYNNGSQAVGENRVDGNMAPGATHQNLVECAGVNSTRFVYFWFDDASSANDATYRIVNETGDMITSQQDIDSDVGENSHVAVTSLDGDKFAMAWFDSTDDDITIAVRDINNNEIVAPTDIDTNPGPHSRVAIAPVRESADATADLFVVVWWNKNDYDIYAAVYNSTGSEVTAPFIVENQQDQAYRLIDVAGKGLNSELCPGYFIVAYTNQSNIGEFKSFNINGTSWDGTCILDNTAPSVTIISPTAGANYTQNSNIPIIVNVTDDSTISSVLANITWDSVYEEVTLIYNATSGYYENTFSNTSWVGQYNITIIATDTYGNVNDTETTYFNIIDATPPAVDIIEPIFGYNYTPSSTVNITVNLTDNVGVDIVLANITWDATYELLTLTYNNATGYYENTFTNTTWLGQYNLTIIANDTNGNVNDTEITYFNIVDLTPPEVFDLIPANSSNYNVTDTIEVGANVTDNVAVDYVFANITLPNGTNNIIVLNISVGAKYNNSYTIPNLEGQYNVTFIANDTSNNINNTETTFFVSADGIPPNITLVSPPNNSLDYNGLIKLKYNVTDETAITNCSLIFQGSINQTNSNISQIETNIFNLENVTNGNYTWSVNCTDAVENEGSSATWLVEVAIPPGATESVNVFETINTYNGSTVTATVEYIDSGSGEVDFNRTGEERNATLDPGIYDIKVTPINHTITELYFENASITGANVSKIVNVDEPVETPLFNANFYAVDTSGTSFNFTQVNVTVEAVGRALYKCPNWNYTSQICTDDRWRKIATIRPGENYTFTISDPTDPGFGEHNRSVNILDKDFYYVPNNQTILQEENFMQNVSIFYISHQLESITVYNHNLTAYYDDLILDTLNETQDYINIYAIDPTDLDFTTAEVNTTANETTQYLLKCDEYISANRTCMDDNYFTYLSVTPGAAYNFTFNSTDPIYIETITGPANVSDSYITDKKRNKNFGLSKKIKVGRAGNKNYRGTLWFNLSNIPSDAKILNAQLQLYAINAQGASSNVTHNIHRVTQSPARPWEELEVTWNKYDNSNSWTSAGGDYLTNATDSVVLPPTIGSQYINFTVTDDVQNFVNNQSTNFGWIIKDSAEATNDIVKYRSSEFSNSNQWPSLTITYFVDLNETVQDAEGNAVNTTIEVRNTVTGEITYLSTGQENHSIQIEPQEYDIFIKPIEHAVSEIVIQDVNITQDLTDIIDIDQPPLNITNETFTEIYAIDPKINFSRIKISGTAETNALYKCDNYTFSQRTCNGGWKRIKKLVPGNEYEFWIDPVDPAFGEGSDKLVLTDITIDGDMSDWDSVISNPRNIQIDGVAGIDDPDNPNSANRDATEFAYTWNETYLYFYLKRIAKGNNRASQIVYLDLDNDGYMEAGEKVFKLTTSKRSTSYDTTLWDYVPDNTTHGDLLTGDGVDMPGSIANSSTLDSGIAGIDSGGIRFESRVSWSQLGINPGAPIQMHISTARGKGTNLPSQIEDNFGAINTLIIDLDIEPDNNGGLAAGGNVTYTHTVTNLGNLNDTIDINTSGTRTNWTVELLYTNGSAITDTDNDTIPDTGLMSPDANFTFYVRLTAPVYESSGVQDTTTVTATSSLNSNISDSVTDTTDVGSILIFPAIQGKISNNTLVNFNHTIVNNQGVPDTIDITYTSLQNYSVSYTFANGTPLTDTDSDSLIDVGNLSAYTSVDIIVKIQIPADAALGTVEEIITYVNSSISPATSFDTALDSLTVAERLEIEPSRESFAGIGAFVFHKHFVHNNYNTTDTFNLNATSPLGWTLEFYDTDMVTLLTDTNNDTNIDTGPIAPYGTVKQIYLKVYVPSDATEGQQDNETVTITSSSDPSYTDFVIDNTTAEKLVLFENAGRTIPSTTFTRDNTTYARGFGLGGINNVYFVWVDSNGTTRKTSADIAVDASDQADDSFVHNDSSLYGNWTVVLFNSQSSTEITRTYFDLVENIKPNITITAAPATINQAQEFIVNAEVEDNSILSHVLLRTTDPNGVTTNFTMINTTRWAFYNEDMNFTANSTGVLAGTYNITAYAYDVFDNWNYSTTQVTVNDIEPPRIYNTSDIPNTQDAGTAVNITTTITDNIQIDKVWVQIIYPNTSSYNFDMNISAGLYEYPFIPYQLGTFNYTIYANDTSGNLVDREYNLTIINPVVSSYSDTEGVTSTANITSSDNAYNVLNITEAGVEYANLTWSLSIPSTAEIDAAQLNIEHYESDNSLDVRIYYLNGSTFDLLCEGFNTPVEKTQTCDLRLHGIDTPTELNSLTLKYEVTKPEVVTVNPLGPIEDNITKTKLSYFDFAQLEVFYEDTERFNFTIVDNTPPDVFDLHPIENTTYYVLDEIEIAANVTDIIQVDTVLANLTYPNGTSTILTLTPAVEDKYNTSFTLPDWVIGQYNITIIANDTSGNINNTETTYFIAQLPKAIAIALSNTLAGGVYWNITVLPITEENATGNNITGPTEYYVNIRANYTNVDVYMRADTNLTSGLNIISLDNEKFSYNITNSTVPLSTKYSISSNFTDNKIADNVPDNTTIWLKFFLNVTGGQAAGTYNNTVEFKAVQAGQPP